MERDMTKGSPAKLILAFSIPLLMGNVFQQFYSMTDAIIVGRNVGVDALAAVGSTGSLSFLVVGFVIGLTGGFSVLVAQRYGARDEDGLRHSVAMAILLCAIFAVVITIIACMSTGWMLTTMKTPKDIYHDAYAYIFIIFLFTWVSVIYNMLAGILRALGDSRTPLYFLIIASILNIVLDLWFIISFNMGVKGAAYATVISQGISGFLCYIYMKKKYPILRFQKKDWVIKKDTITRLLKIGLPMSFQFSVTAIGVMILQSAINRFGSTVVAAYTAASKVEQIVIQPLASLGITMATYTGQNLGAGRNDRIIDGVKKCLIISLVFSVLGGLIIFLFGEQIVLLFLSEPDADVLQAARQYFRTIMTMFFPLGMLFVFRNTLQGLGDGLWPFLGGVTELIVRSIVAIVFSSFYGYAAICYASPLSWITASILLAVAYVLHLKKVPTTTGNGEEAYD